MANKLKLLIDFIAYSEASPSNNPDYSDSTIIKNQIQESSFSELSRQQITVPVSTTDLVIPIADGTCEYILIFCDQDLSIKMNGSSDPILLKPRAAGLKTFVFMNKGTITGITVTNSSSTVPANLDLISVNL